MLEEEELALGRMADQSRPRRKIKGVAWARSGWWWVIPTG